MNTPCIRVAGIKIYVLDFEGRRERIWRFLFVLFLSRPLLLPSLSFVIVSDEGECLRFDSLCIFANSLKMCYESNTPTVCCICIALFVVFSM